MTVSPVDAAAPEPKPDPTFEELSATIARYDDWDDKLTIALGNFNRVRAERDEAVSLLAVREAELVRKTEALQQIAAIKPDAIQFVKENHIRVWKAVGVARESLAAVPDGPEETTC